MSMIATEYHKDLLIHKGGTIDSNYLGGRSSSKTDTSKLLLTNLYTSYYAEIPFVPFVILFSRGTLSGSGISREDSFPLFFLIFFKNTARLS